VSVSVTAPPANTTAAAPVSTILTAPPAGTRAAAPAGRGVADVRVTAAPAATVVAGVEGQALTTLAKITASVWDPSNNLLASLPHVMNHSWLDEFSKIGDASFEVPLDDASTALIQERCIVKFAWHGGKRFACRINSEGVEIVRAGRRWLRFESQPGVMSVLADLQMYPEYPLERQSSPDRKFDWTAGADVWLVDSEWTEPDGAVTPLNVRADYPLDLRHLDKTAQWISHDLTDYAPIGQRDLFRGTLTIEDDNTPILIHAAASGPLSFNIDGVEVISPQSGQPNDSSVVMTLDSGGHTIAVSASNSPYPRSTHGARIMFIASICRYDNRKPGELLYHTGTSSWKVAGNSIKPGWFDAQILARVIEEARLTHTGRHVLGPLAVTFGYTDFVDSHGEAWTKRTTASFPVGQINGADVAMQLAEQPQFEPWMSPNLRIYAWKRRGSDLTGTVALEHVADGGNILSYQQSRDAQRQTVILTQLHDGSFQETPDGDALADIGRIEAGLSMGSALGAETAERAATAQLNESAHPLTKITVVLSTLTGPQPYVDFNIGDTMPVLGRRDSGSMKARVMSISPDASVFPPRVTVELVEDLS